MQSFMKLYARWRVHEKLKKTEIFTKQLTSFSKNTLLLYDNE